MNNLYVYFYLYLSSYLSSYLCLYFISFSNRLLWTHLHLHTLTMNNLYATCISTFLLDNEHSVKWPYEWIYRFQHTMKQNSFHAHNSWKMIYIEQMGTYPALEASFRHNFHKKINKIRNWVIYMYTNHLIIQNDFAAMIVFQFQIIKTIQFFFFWFDTDCSAEYMLAEDANDEYLHLVWTYSQR